MFEYYVSVICAAHCSSGKAGRSFQLNLTSGQVWQAENSQMKTKHSCHCIIQYVARFISGWSGLAKNVEN